MFDIMHPAPHRFLSGFAFVHMRWLWRYALFWYEYFWGFRRFTVALNPEYFLIEHVINYVINRFRLIHFLQISRVRPVL
jgi:hypothetical protein